MRLWYISCNTLLSQFKEMQYCVSVFVAVPGPSQLPEQCAIYLKIVRFNRRERTEYQVDAAGSLQPLKTREPGQ